MSDSKSTQGQKQYHATAILDDEKATSPNHNELLPGKPVNHLSLASPFLPDRKLFLVLLFIFFAYGCFAQVSEPFPARTVKDDFDYLYKTLEATHYDLFANTKKEKFDHAYKEINNSINKSLTMIQVNRLFQPFTALSNHGHCSIELPFSSYVSYGKQGGTLFPFTIHFSNNHVYIRESYSDNSSIVRGDEILSINEKPIQDVLDGIYQYLSGENNYSKQIQIEYIYFPRIYWMVYDKCDTFDIVIKKIGGEIKEITINAIPAGNFEAKVSQEEPLLNPNKNFRIINDDAAYLRPGCFYNAPKGGELVIDSEIAENKEFITFLESSFNEIHRRKTKNLIIDLRGNPGGSATFSNPMVSFFATKPFIGGSKLFVKSSQINKTFWRDFNDANELSMDDTTQLFMKVKKEVLAHKNGTFFEVPLLEHQPRKDPLRFDGNIYVLVNRFSFSEAIVVSAMIQDYEFGKLIGEETSPVMYGDARQFKLPNTQITVTVPTSFFIRPNGDTTLHGTVPDYTVEDDIFTKKDEVLDYTLKLIRESKQ